MDILKRNAEFEGQDPQRIVAWAIAEFKPKIALSTSFGTGSAALLHMVAAIDPTTPVLFLETGFHFKETLTYKDELIKLLGLKDFRMLRREMPSDVFFKQYGEKP